MYSEVKWSGGMAECAQLSEGMVLHYEAVAKRSMFEQSIGKVKYVM